MSAANSQKHGEKGSNLQSQLQRLATWPQDPRGDPSII